MNPNDLETCYIFRDTTKVLVGPFYSKDAANKHRDEKFRSAGIIICADEAVRLVIERKRLFRVTPDEDMRISEMRPSEPERAA